MIGKKKEIWFWVVLLAVFIPLAIIDVRFAFVPIVLAAGRTFCYNWKKDYEEVKRAP